MDGNYNENSGAGLAIGVIIAFIILVGGLITVLFGSWYTVDQSQRAILLQNGAFVSIVEPGLHFKWPLMQSVVKVSLQNNKEELAEVDAYSQDQQPAKIKLSVNYRALPDKLEDLYARFGYLEYFVDRVIQPRVQNEFKNVFGQYNAATSIQARAKLSQDVTDAIKKAMANEPVVVESVQIENVDFSDAYEQSVEQRMLAEVEVHKFKQNFEREQIQAQIKVTQAKAEADSTKLRGEGEAAAISARAKALAENQQLVQLTVAEKWNGILPTTMIPGGGVPLVNLNTK